MIDLYAHLGNGLSLWPPGNRKTGLHLTSGIYTLIADVFSAALLQPGEHPIDFRFGCAPNLFENASNLVPELYQYNLNQTLTQYFVGRIAKFQVQVGTHPENIGKLLVVIEIVPTENNQVYVLEYGLEKLPQGFIIDTPSVNGVNLLGPA